MTVRWLIFDTETTSLTMPQDAPLDKQPKVIEIALIEVVENVITREKSWLVNPGEPITEETTKITGITGEMVKDAPPFVQVLPELISGWFLGAYGWCAHNLPFDRAVMVHELRRLNREFAFPYPPEQLCTVSAFHHTAGRRLKLTELYERVMGKPLVQTHRALDDTRALAEIVIKENCLL